MDCRLQKKQIEVAEVGGREPCILISIIVYCFHPILPCPSHLSGLLHTISSPSHHLVSFTISRLFHTISSPSQYLVSFTPSHPQPNRIYLITNPQRALALIKRPDILALLASQSNTETSSQAARTASP